MGGSGYTASTTIRRIDLAKVTAEAIGIERRGDEIVIRIPVDGRQRAVVLPGREALRVSNTLGNAAVDALRSGDVDDLPDVLDIKLLPFGREAGAAHAAMRIETSVGPLLLRFDQRWLEAIEHAARAALENAQPSGSA
jgi:hypothetical protein